MKRIWQIVFLLEIQLSWSSNPVVVDIPVEVSVGPAFHFIPSALSDGQTFVPGISLDVFAVISPEIIKAHQDRIPSNWRSMIDPDQEFHIKPFWLLLMPTNFMLQAGTTHQAWSASLSLLGLQWNNQPTPTTLVQAGVKLPTFTYAWFMSPRIQEGGTKMLGVGITPFVQGLWKVSPVWSLSASWDQQIYVPLPTTEYKTTGGSPRNWMWQGVASIMLHVRIPTKRSL